eukprot:scaffold447_cov307-Pinguiococcus_pyrenoidosus.AAC.4
MMGRLTSEAAAETQAAASPDAAEDSRPQYDSLRRVLPSLDSGSSLKERSMALFELARISYGDNDIDQAESLLDIVLPMLAIFEGVRLSPAEPLSLASQLLMRSLGMQRRRSGGMATPGEVRSPPPKLRRCGRSCEAGSRDLPSAEGGEWTDKSMTQRTGSKLGLELLRDSCR